MVSGSSIPDVVSTPMLDWIRSKMEAAELVGDMPAYRNYRDMYKLWDRRLNEKARGNT